MRLLCLGRVLSIHSVWKTSKLLSKENSVLGANADGENNTRISAVHQPYR